jgi:hypothetical protein
MIRKFGPKVLGTKIPSNPDTDSSFLSFLLSTPSITELFLGSFNYNCVMLIALNKLSAMYL